MKPLAHRLSSATPFHLWLRPGQEIMKLHGDLHDFMQWKGPILTDSGGFRVFSPGDIRKITEQGVHFRNPINGDPIFLDPENPWRFSTISAPIS